MHDTDDRIGSFIEEASERDLDFKIQLDDFVRDYDYNLEFLSNWNSYPGDKYHVIGNHELDGGFSKKDVVEYLGMPDQSENNPIVPRISNRELQLQSN